MAGCDLVQLVQQVPPLLGRVLYQLFSLEDLKIGQGCGARYWLAAKSQQVRQRGAIGATELLGNVLSTNRRGDRSIAATQAFAHGHDVGYYIPMLGGKHGAGTAEASDNFVENQDYTMPIAYLPETWQVFRRWDHHATSGRNGFGDDGRDGAWVFEQDQIRDGVDAVDLTLRVGLTVIAAIAIRR